jgi:ABC-type branched-subunit amino acid transport system ATPase component
MPLLEVRDLSIAHDDAQTILQGVSFQINEGDVIVLTGRSGSGKTTLLKSLAHLVVYQGHISFYGRCVSCFVGS